MTFLRNRPVLIDCSKMSIGDLLATTIHSSPLIIPLRHLKEEIDLESMSSPAESALIAEREQQKESNLQTSLSDSIRLTPIDLDDLQQNPQNYTIADIKRFLKERDLPTNGNKSVLVERLIVHG